LPLTRSVYAHNPFEHYQSKTGLDETGVWKASNKTAHIDEQSKINLKAIVKTTTLGSVIDSYSEATK
jgi:hypothetical protein